MMAIAKINFVQQMRRLVRYVIEGKGPEDPIHTHGCDESNITEEFDEVYQFDRGKGREREADLPSISADRAPH